MILGLDFKEESEDRWHSGKDGERESGNLEQLSFPGNLLQGFAIGGSMCIRENKQGYYPENKFVTVGEKPSVVGKKPMFVGSCRPLKDWRLGSEP